MDFSYLDREEYRNIRLLRMADNDHGDIPFFIRKYSMSGLTSGIHRHEYMQINYVYRGKGKHYVNNHEFSIVKGDIFVIPPYIPHCIAASDNDGIEVFEFEFEPEFVNQNLQSIENIESYFDFAYIEPFLVSESQIKPRLNLTGKVQVETEKILNEALEEFMTRKPGFMLLVKSLLLKLLVYVGRAFTEDLKDSESHLIYARHRDSIFGAIRFMEENYTAELNVEEVAKRFALSQSYFSYLFKSITSMTFTEYINRLRISKAMELLKNSDKRVLDICFDVGFNNVNHFNRLFRQQTGVSPLAYRKTSV